MAKKWKKKADDGDYGFKYPEFDEREYLVKELKETRILIVTILMAVIFAVISLASMLIMPNKDALVGLIVGLVGIMSLRFVYPAFKIDTSAFDWKKWFMNVLSFFGVWLAIWILLCNPPISDFTPPSIDQVRSLHGDTTTYLKDNVLDVNISGTTSFTIEAHIADNSQLDSGSVKLDIQRAAPHTSNISRPDEHTFRWDINNIPQGQYPTVLSAKDTNGNWKIFTFTLDVKHQI
jgi:hypothetical protein